MGSESLKEVDLRATQNMEMSWLPDLVFRCSTNRKVAGRSGPQSDRVDDLKHQSDKLTTKAVQMPRLCIAPTNT